MDIGVVVIVVVAIVGGVWLITSFRSLNNIMPISFFLPAFTSTYFYSF